jgi:hypothetical protein
MLGEAFDFKPDLGVEGAPQLIARDWTELRVGTYFRMFLRDGGSSYPNRVASAHYNDYAFVVRNQESDVIVAIGDGYLCAARGIRSFLNIIVNQSISLKDPLFEEMVSKIMSHAVDIYVDRSRHEDADTKVSDRGLKFQTDLAGAIVNLKKENRYFQDGTVKLIETVYYDIQREGSDAYHAQDDIACIKLIKWG